MKPHWIAVLLFFLAPIALRAAEPGASIRYQLDRDAVVSLNVTRPDGWVVRQLVIAERQTAGAHALQWDGRDELGYLLPPGDYQARLLTHDGIAWKYLTSVGNSGTPPWRTPDGTGGWGGNHGQNTAVATDETGAYLGWASTEGPPCIVKRTQDGAKGIWHMELGPFEGVVCLATDGTHLYGVNAKRLVVIDREQHRVLATLNIDAGPDGPVTEIPPELTKFSWSFANHQPPPKADPLVWGLAAGGGRVYVSLPWRDRVEAFGVVKDAAGKVELKPQPEEGFTAPKPAGLVYDPASALWVALAGKGQVVRVDLQTKASQVVAEGLNRPLALARAGDGTFYVTEGPPSHQIKKLGPDGKLLAAFGRAGGPRGDNAGVREYVAEAFWQPCALAANPDGRVWFVDDMFKRHGRLSPEGKFLYEGFGAVNYAASCALNPNDLTEVFSTMWGDVTFRVDFTKPGWFRPARRLEVKWAGESLGFDTGFGAQRLLSRAGKTYQWTGAGLSIVETDYRRPVMCFLPRIPDKGPLAELAAKRGARNRGWNTDVTMWCDLNGDAAVQPDEVQFVPLPGARHGPQFYGEGAMNDDFSLVTYGYAWAPSEFTAAGVPVYRGDAIRFSEKHNPLVDGGGTQPVKMPNGGYVGMDGQLDPGYPPGQGFWSGRSVGQSFVGMAPDWKPLWRVGRKARGVARPGEIYFNFRSIGQVDGCAFFDDVEGCVHVVHQDGFYLQRVLQDSWRTSVTGPDVIGVENFSGAVLKDASGRRYLTISSEQATHVFELTGFESIKVHPPQPVRLEAGSLVTAASPYRIKRLPPGAQATPGHMGGLLPVTGIMWPQDVEPLVLRRSGQPIGEVRMLHDGKTLWVLAHRLDGGGRGPVVLQPNGELAKGDPLGNGDTIVVLLQAAGTPGAKSDAVEATLADNPAGGAAGQAGCPFRFVYANVNTRGLAVVSQWQGEPIPGQVGAADKWKTGPNARVDGQPYGSGVAYELAIPLDWVLQGQDVSRPVKARLDVGFFTAAGTNEPARLDYWSGRDPAMKDPADRTFRPAGWGEVVFDTEPVMGGSAATAVASAWKDWSAPTRYPLGGAGEANAPATFQVAWDKANFHARVRVRDATPLQNAASEPAMIFKGGDAVALTFGKTGKDGTEQKLIVAQVGGQPVAMLYRPKSETKHPCTFQSPVSTLTFDYVAPLPAAQVVFQKETGGYVAEITVPWQALGYAPQPVQTIPFDVQVIFSDATGARNAMTAWWRSASADAHANNDIPTEIRLYPAEWGQLLLK